MDLTITLPAEQVIETDQYTLWQILGIWALVALPMFLLAWVIAPAVIPHLPFHPGITFWLLMIVGMIWQFMVSVIILYQELGTLRWSVVRKRTRFQAPRTPGTDTPNFKLFVWVLPAILFGLFQAVVLDNFINAPVTWLFPDFQHPDYMDIAQLATPEFQGAWWLLGIAFVSNLFNYLLGEELLFRGVLLPKMKGVFGKWDWVANTVLFGLYHLHLIWNMPSIIISSLPYAWPARRFQSSWMAVIVHGVEGVVLFIAVLAVISGMTL